MVQDSLAAKKWKVVSFLFVFSCVDASSERLAIKVKQPVVVQIRRSKLGVWPHAIAEFS